MLDGTRGSMRSGAKPPHRGPRGDKGSALLVVMAAAAILFITAAAVIGVVVFQQAQQSRAQAVTRATGLAQQGMEVYLTALRIDPNYRTRVPLIAGRGEDGTWTVAANVASGTITAVGHDEQSGLYHVIQATVTGEDFSGYTIVSGSPLALGKSSGSGIDIKGRVRGNGTITLNQTFNDMTSVEYASGTVMGAGAGNTPTIRVSRVDFAKAGSSYPNMYTAASTRETWNTGALSSDYTALTNPLAFYRDPSDPFRNYWAGTTANVPVKNQADPYKTPGSQVDLAGVGIDFGSGARTWTGRNQGVFYVREVLPATVSAAAKLAANAPTPEQYIDLARTDPVWNVNQGGNDPAHYEPKARGLDPSGSNVIYVGGDYDVYVKGEYSRSVTIVSEGDIYIIGSITRAASSPTATLGLVAKGDIIICGAMPTASKSATYTAQVGDENSYSGLTYVRGAQTSNKAFGETMPDDVTIEAAILSVSGQIVMDPRDLTSVDAKPARRSGLLHIKGSLAAAQGLEGPNFVNEPDPLFGGFADVLIEYDDQLQNTPPPLFPQLGAGTLKIKRWDEHTSTTDPNAGLSFPEPTDYRPHGSVPIGSEETTYTSLEPDGRAPQTISNADAGQEFAEEAVITLTAVDHGTGVAQTWHRIVGLDAGRQLGNTIHLTEETSNTATTYTVEFGSVGLDGEEEATQSVTVRVVGPDTLLPEPATTVIDSLNPTMALPDGYPQVDDPDYLVYGTFYPVFTAVDTTEGTGIYEVIVVQKNDPQHVSAFAEPDPPAFRSDPNPDLAKPLRYAMQPVLPPETGFMTRQFSYYAIDAAGNRELPSRTLTIRQHAPDETKPITFCDVQPIYIGPATIHLNGVDDVEGQGWLDTWYSLDDGTTWTTSTVNPTAVAVPAPRFGQDPVEHTLLFYSRDRATNGAVLQPNAEDVQSVSFIVAPALPDDLTAPTTTSDAKPSYIGPVVISLTATDTGGVAHIFWRLDDAPAVEGTRIEVQDPWTGTAVHHIDFWSEDWAGNLEVPKTATFTVTPEQVAPVTSAHNLDLYAGPAVFQLTSEDNVGGSGLAGTYYKIDDGRYQLGAGMPGLTWVTVTGEGTHTVSFYSVDHARNNEVAKTCTFVIDTVAPTTVDDNVGSYVGQATIDLTATDAGSGVKTTQWRSASDGLVHDATEVPLGAGSWDVMYWSVDNAGNVESPLKTMHVEVTAAPDTTAPDSYDEITAYYKAPGPAALRLLSWDVQSGVATMYYAVDGGPTQTIAGKENPPAYYAPLVSDDGTHTIEYWASDKAGNIESPRHSKTFMLDTVLPLTTTNARAGMTYWANQMFVLEGSDVGSGVKATYYSLDGGLPVRGTTVWVPAPTDGYSRPHVIRYWSVDLAGNTEVVKSKAFTSKPSDTIAPITNVVSSTTATECISLVLRAMDNLGGSAVQHIYYRIDTGAIVQGVLDNASTLNTPKQTMFTVRGSGAHTVEYWATDYAGNIEIFKIFYANVDNEAPTTGSDLRALYNTAATIKLTAADNAGGTGVATTLYRLDGGSVTTGTAPITTIVVPAPASGTVQHSLEFWSTDVANNIETPHKMGSFKIDVTPPATTSDAVKTYSGPAAIVLNATDDAGGSGVAYTRYKLDGATYVQGSTVTVPAPLGGSRAHTLEYWSVDKAENTEPTRIATFTVAAVANMTFSEMNPGEGATIAIRNPDVSVKATADQRIASATAMIDGVSTPVTWSNPAGYYTEGQTEEWYPDPDCVDYCPDSPDCWNWYSVIIGGPSVWVPSDPNIATAVFPTAGLANGPHVASVTFTNESDASKTKNWTFYVNAAADVRPPVTTSDAKTYYKAPATITLTASDEVGGMGLANIYYRLDGVQSVGTIPSAAFSVPTAGRHTLEFWSTDRATPANKEATKTVTFTVDWTPPTTAAGYSGSCAGTATVFLSAADNAGGSGLKSTNYSLDNGAVLSPTIGANTVAQYHFDEGTGATVADVSGNGYGGTMNVGTTGLQTTLSQAWTNGAAGRFGSSLNFDGASDYVDLGSRAALNNLGSAFSVAAWVKTSGNSGMHVIAGRQNDWRLHKTDNALYFEHRNTAGTIAYVGAVNTSSDWVYVVGTFDSGTGKANLYINGVLAVSKDQTGTTRVSQTANEIGANNAWHTGNVYYNDYYWNGQIDEVTFSNVALTAAEIQNYYAVATASGVPPLQLTIAPPASGPAVGHTLRYWSVDKADNTETTKSATFSVSRPVDTTPPTTTSNAVATYYRPAPIVLTATDNPGGWGVATTYSKLDGAAAVTGTSPSTGLAGAHTMQFWSVDAAGNIETTKSVSYTVLSDTTPPVTTHNALASYVGTATVTLTATDPDNGWGVSGVYYMGPAATYYRVDDGARQTGTLITVGPPMGDPVPHHIDFWSVDAAGNVETTKTTPTFMVEGVPANIVWSNHTPAKLLSVRNSGPAVSVTGTALRAIASAQAKIDGVSYAVQPLSWLVPDSSKATATILTSNLASGLHSAEVTFRLTDGSRATEKWSFTTDVIAPTTTSDALAAYVGTATIALSANDNVGGSGLRATYYKVDDVGTRSVTAIAAPFYTAGSYNPAAGRGAEDGLGDEYLDIYTSANGTAWNLRATVNGAGLSSWTCPGYTDSYVRIDFRANWYFRAPYYWDNYDEESYVETPVYVTGQSGKLGPLSNSTWTFTMNDSWAGGFSSITVNGVSYTNTSTDGALYTVGTPLKVLPPVWGSAVHHIDFWSEDVVGNVEAVRTATFTVNALPDTTAPTSRATVATYYPVPTMISVTATDNVGGWGVSKLLYTIDGGATQTIDATQTGNVPLVASIYTGSGGTHTLRYWAQDRATVPNVESQVNTATYAVALDTTKPHTASDAKATYVGPATITLTASDNVGGWGLGSGATAYKLDGAAVTSGTVINVPDQIAGTVSHTLLFWSVDRAGNKEDTETANFTVAAIPENMTFSVVQPTGFIRATNPTVILTGQSTLPIVDQPAGVVATLDGVTVVYPTITFPTTTTTTQRWVEGGSVWVDGYWEDWADDGCLPCTECWVDGYYTPGGYWEDVVTTAAAKTQPTVTFPTSGLSVGQHTVSVTFTVSSGRQAVKTWTFNVDTIAPTTTSNAVANYTGVAPIVLTALDNVGGAGVKATYYKWDNASTYTTYTATVSMAAPSSGSATHTITFYSNDLAQPSPGNVEAAKTATFSVSAQPDTTAPWGNGFSGGGGSYSTPTTFTLSGGDTGWGVRYICYKLDGGATVTVETQSLPIGSGAEGRHTLEWWVVDWANLSSPHYWFWWIVDTQAPTTTSNALTDYTGNAIITLTATDTPKPPATVSSGVASTSWTIDDGAGGSGTGTTVNVAAPISGSAVNHHIDFRSVDNAGNTEAWKPSITFAVAPAIAPVVWTGQTPATSTPVTIRNPSVAVTGQATAQITAVSAWLDGNPVTPWPSWLINYTKLTASFATSNLTDGVHTVKFRYVVSGQGQAETTWNFTVAAPENQPPVTTDNRQSSYVGTATITLTAVDYPLVGASGVKVTNYTLDGVARTGTSIVVAPPVYGSPVTHTLSYWSQDNNLNNESVKGTYSFTVAPASDVTPPTTSSNAASTYVGNSTITLSAVDAGTGVAGTYYSYDDNATQYAGTSIALTAPTWGSETRHVHFWSVDRALPTPNTEAKNTANFTISALPDYTPPTTSHNAGSLYGSTTSLITLSATDNSGGWGVSRIMYVQDGGATQTVNATFTSILVGAEGSHSLRFWAVDRAERSEIPQTVFYKVDTTPPATTSNALKTYIGSASISLSATDAPGGSGVQYTYYKVDGSVNTYQYLGSPITVAGPASGLPASHGVSFWSVDFAGKTEAMNTATFTISLPADNTPPTTTSDTKPFYAAPSTINLSPVDNIGGWGIDKTYYSIDDSAYAVGVAAPTGDSGAHHIDFYSTDLAGNRETTQTAGYNVDRTPPTTTSNAVASYTGTASITLSAVDNTGGSGVKSTAYSIDDGIQVSGTSISVAPPAWDSAAHHIDFYSTDNMSNVESSHRADFVVHANPDTTPPTTTSNALPAYSVPATITLTSTENVGGWGITTIDYSLDGSPTVVGFSTASGGVMTASCQVGTGGGGAHTLKFWATDKAGKSEPTKTASYTVANDSTPPVTISNAVAYYIGSATVKLSATDVGWGVATTYYRVDGGATQTIAGGANQTAVPPFIAPIAGSDTHTLQYWSVDKAGNLETVNSVTFVVDAVPANVTFHNMTPAAGAVLTTATMPVSVRATADKNITTITATIDGVPKTLTTTIGSTTATSSFNAAGLSNAEHTVVFTVTVLGGAQASKSWTFKVEVQTDFTPPTTLSDARLTYFGGAVINLTPTDDAGGTGVKATYFTVDGGAQTTGTVIVVPGPTTGDPVSHTVTYWSVDNARNTEVANVRTFVVGLTDKIAPTTTSDALAAYHTVSTIRLSASDNVGGSGVAHTYYILDHGAIVEGTLLGAGGEGPHTLEYWSVDNSGNIETSTKLAFKVDLTAPVTTSDAVADYTGQADIRLSASDEVGGSGVKYTYYKIDGGQQVSGLTASVAPPTYASAQHTIEFWSVDVAGNIEATKTASFNVNALPDTTPPTTISDAKLSYQVPGLITLTATDNEGGWGVDRTFYRLDTGLQIQGTSVRTGGAGDHKLEFWSVDKAGKTETPHKFAYYSVIAEDVTPPVTTSDALASYIGDARISLVATDNSGAPCITYYRVDTGPDTTGTAVTVPAPATGSASHTLWFWSVDINGKTETPKSANFTISELPANLTFSGMTPGDGSTVSVRNPVISVKVTSTSRDIVRAVIQVDGVARASIITTGSKQATATAQVTGLANLSHTVSATFTDSSGATSVKTWTFTVAGAADTTAPLTTHDAVAYYRVNATIRLAAADDEGGTGVAATYYRIDGGSAIAGGPPTSMVTTISVSVAGTHTIEYWSVDAANNAELVPDGPNSQNSHRVLRINLDKVGPTTKSNAMESYTGEANITLTATDNSLGSGIAATYYIIDSGVRQTGTSVVVPAPANGSQLHTVYFYSVDNAGNVEATKSASFASWAPEDATPPVTLSNAVATYPVPGVITLTATDAGWGVAHTYYNLDGTGDNEGTMVGTGGAGTHTLQFWSVDVADNPETRNTVTYTVAANDTVAPTTTSNAVATYTGTGQIQLTATDNVPGSGVAHIYYTWDDGPRTESTLIGVSGVGAHHVDMWSVDWAGNSEIPVRVDFTVVAPDLTAPTTTSNALSSYVGTATVTLTPTDNVGGVGVWVTFFRIDDGAQQEGRTVAIAPPVTGSATHEVRFWSVDNAGNTESEQRVSFTVLPAVDGIAPTTTHNGVASYTGTATITLTPTDNPGGQGVNRTVYTINDGPEQIGVVIVRPAPATGSVVNHIDFWSFDNAGNREATKTFTFTSNAVSVGSATLSFTWGDGYISQSAGSWARLHVEDSNHVVLYSYYAQRALGQDLNWSVTVPAGQYYYMVVDAWVDGDTGDFYNGPNVVRAPALGTMVTNSTTTLAY
jgi:hypothetical protein